MMTMIDITWLIMPLIVHAGTGIKVEDLPTSVAVGLYEGDDFAVIHWDKSKAVSQIVSDTWSICILEDSLEKWKTVHRYTGEETRCQIIYEFSGSIDDFESDLSSLMLIMPKFNNDWDYITYHVKY